MSGKKKKRDNRITFFRSDSDAGQLHNIMTVDGLERLENEQRQLLEFDYSDLGGPGDLRCLYRSPYTTGPSLILAWAKSGYILPPHSHSSDCIYYVTGGEMRMGTVTLKRGDGVFIPAGRIYSFTAGPEGMEMLEFRTRSSFNMLLQPNDIRFWDRLREAIATGREKWKQETRPSQTRSASN